MLPRQDAGNSVADGPLLPVSSAYMPEHVGSTRLQSSECHTCVEAVGTSYEIVQGPLVTSQTDGISGGRGPCGHSRRGATGHHVENLSTRCLCLRASRTELALGSSSLSSNGDILRCLRPVSPAFADKALVLPCTTST